ncbi:hypothetical protein C7S15_4013 [Burkholderia cepacia]|nr:hypothetical protein [Burkholderia cepacia]
MSPPVDPASAACADEDEAAPDGARVAPLPVGARGLGFGVESIFTMGSCSV